MKNTKIEKDLFPNFPSFFSYDISNVILYYVIEKKKTIKSCTALYNRHWKKKKSLLWILISLDIYKNDVRAMFTSGQY